MFLEHVIGGKQLSPRPDFTAVVRGAHTALWRNGDEVRTAEAAGASDIVALPLSKIGH